MNLHRVIMALAVVLGSIIASRHATSQGIDLAITNIRNQTGKLRVALYQNQAQFSCNKPIKTLIINKSHITNHRAHLAMDSLLPGNYGIAVLDDENCNGRMDYGWLMPEEGYGFSGITKPILKKPSFNDFSFKLNGRETLEIVLHYF